MRGLVYTSVQLYGHAYIYHREASMSVLFGDLDTSLTHTLQGGTNEYLIFCQGHSNYSTYITWFHPTFQNAIASSIKVFLSFLLKN